MVLLTCHKKLTLYKKFPKFPRILATKDISPAVLDVRKICAEDLEVITLNIHIKIKLIRLHSFDTVVLAFVQDFRKCDTIYN